MLQWTRLAVEFDAARMRAELDALNGGTWVGHFNQRDFAGDWSGLALRARWGHEMNIGPFGGAEEYSDTPLMEACPYIAEVVQWFACPMKSARLLKLAPGARIHEHTDNDLQQEHGELRLHVPIQTNDDVEFVVAGRRLFMRPGEAWFVDFSQPHWIANRGTTPRVHLVMDVIRNAWMQELLERSARELVTETFAPSGLA